MSRSEKRRRREERERLRQPAGSFRQFKRRQLDRIGEAAELIEQGRWPEARHILEQHTRTHPMQVAPLRMLLEVCHRQRDYGDYARTCERLLELEPHDHDLHLPMASAYELTLRPASAILEYRRFLEHCPRHALAEEARDSLSRLEGVLAETLSDAPFPPESRFELAALHERVLIGISNGQYEQALALAETLRARCPEFIPVLNNLSQLYFLTGRMDAGIALARQVVEREPENVQAVANLARFLLLSGQPEAAAWHDRLLALPSDHPDVWCKKAETFSFFGNDAAVLDAFAGARRAGLFDGQFPVDPRMHHFAGVAAARQGDERAARRYFRESLTRLSDPEISRINLDDLDRRPSERKGPWALGLEYWVRPAVIDRLKDLAARRADPAARLTDEQTFARLAREFPELVALVPHLLDRGDDLGREMARQIAFAVATPELIDALRRFCQSQRGTDDMRLKTADRLSREEQLPGPVRMWLRGAWQEIELRGYEISDEPVELPYHTPEFLELDEAALDALHAGDGRAAEKLLKECIQAVGEQPEVLNNLAVAYHLQNRDEDARRLAHEVHERWPDYFFGRIQMAQFAIVARQFDKAAAYLRPLEKLRRLHSSEFSAMCEAFVRLYRDWRKIDAARAWLDIWKEIQPDHPRIPGHERRLDASTKTSWLAPWRSKLFSRVGRQGRSST